MRDGAVVCLLRAVNYSLFSLSIHELKKGALCITTIKHSMSTCNIVSKLARRAHKSATAAPTTWSAWKGGAIRSFKTFASGCVLTALIFAHCRPDGWPGCPLLRNSYAVSARKFATVAPASASSMRRTIHFAATAPSNAGDVPLLAGTWRRRWPDPYEEGAAMLHIKEVMTPQAEVI